MKMHFWVDTTFPTGLLDTTTGRPRTHTFVATKSLCGSTSRTKSMSRDIARVTCGNCLRLHKLATKGP